MPFALISFAINKDIERAASVQETIKYIKELNIKLISVASMVVNKNNQNAPSLAEIFLLNKLSIEVIKQATTVVAPINSNKNIGMMHLFNHNTKPAPSGVS